MTIKLFVDRVCLHDFHIFDHHTEASHLQPVELLFDGIFRCAVGQTTDLIHQTVSKAHNPGLLFSLFYFVTKPHKLDFFGGLYISNALTSPYPSRSEEHTSEL